MKNLNLAILLTIAALFLPFGCMKKSGQSDDEKAESRVLNCTVVQVQGMVVGKMGGKTVKYRKGNVLKAGDTIKTGPASFVDLELEGKGVARVKALTFFTIKDLNSANLSLHVSKGRLLASLNKLLKHEKLQVTTPTMVAGIRGTSFMVSAEDRQASLSVLVGSVEVKKGSKSVRVREMKEVNVGKKIEKEKVIKGVSLINIKDLADVSGVEKTKDAEQIKVNIAKLEIIDRKQLTDKIEINKILEARSTEINLENTENKVQVKDGKVQVKEKEVDRSEDLMIKSK